MQVLATSLPEVKLILPKLFRDERGFFCETYNRQALIDASGIDAVFVQDNHSRSEQVGVVRGMHFQTDPHAQGKLVRVVAGAIFDVAVDIRTGSPTYGQHMAIVLSATNFTQAWIPVGFAHGFCTLEAGTEVIYKVTAPYDAACDRGLAWDDPSLGIKWPVTAAAAVLSAKDRQHPRLSQLPDYFSYKPTARA